MGPEIIPPIILKWLIEKILDKKILPEIEEMITGNEFQKLGNKALYETIRVNPDYKRILNYLREQGIFEIEDATELNEEKICNIFSGQEKNTCFNFLGTLKDKYIETIKELGSKHPLTKFMLEKIQKHDDFIIESKYADIVLFSDNTKRDFESYLKKRGNDYVLRKQHEIFIPPPGIDDARTILRSRNLLIITGEPHIGKSTLAEELLFEMYLDGYNVKRTDAESSPISIIIKQIEMIEKGVFLFDDPFGSIELTNQTFANRLNDLLQSSKDVKLIISTRKNILREILQKTKIIETIPEIKDFIYEIKEYPKESLLKILENHLDYKKFPGRALIMKHKDQIVSRLIFPHNIDILINILPEDVEEKKLNRFIKDAERIKLAKKKEFQTFTNEEKLVLYIMSTTIFISINDLKQTYYSLIEKLEYEKINISEILEKIKDWLRFDTKEFLDESISLVKFYHASYYRAVSEELLKGKKFTEIVFSETFQYASSYTKSWMCIAISINLETLPIEVINLLTKLWNDRSSYVSNRSKICFVDNYRKLPQNLKDFFLKEFHEEFSYKDVTIGFMIEQYDKIPEILKSALIQILDFKPESFFPRKTDRDKMLFNDAIEFIIGPNTMQALIKNYDQLPFNIRKKVFEFSKSEITPIKGNLASSIIENYNILPNNLKKLIPTLIKDDKIKEFVGKSIISNYDKLTENIRVKFFKLWEKVDLEGKKRIIRAMTIYYDRLPNKVKNILDQVIEGGNEELLLEICHPLPDKFEQMEKSQKFLRLKAMEKLNQISLTQSENALCSRGFLITSIMSNFNTLPSILQNYAIKNWRSIDELHQGKFFHQIYELWEDYPELITNIFYDALREEKSAVAITAASLIIKDYSKLPFEITRMIPSIIKNARLNDKNARLNDKITIIDPYYELQKNIINNWDNLPDEIQEFVFYKRKINFSFSDSLLKEIEFQSYIAANYHKFPKRANEHFKYIIENIGEKERDYLIGFLFHATKKSPYAVSIFSYLKENLDVQFHFVSYILTFYQEVHFSLKNYIFDEVKNGTLEDRIIVAINIINKYNHVPRAVQDLVPEILTTLPTKEKYRILAFWANNLVEQKNYEDARNLYKKILKKYPRHEITIANICELSLIMKEYTETEKYLKKIINSSNSIISIISAYFALYLSILLGKDYSSDLEKLLEKYYKIPKDQEIKWKFSNIELMIEKTVKGKNKSVLSIILKLLKREISIEEFQRFQNEGFRKSYNS